MWRPTVKAFFPLWALRFHNEWIDKLSFAVPQSSYMAQLPYIIMAVDAFVAGVLCLLLPETNKAPTAETLESESPTALLSVKNEEDDEEPQEKMTVM